MSEGEGVVETQPEPTNQSWYGEGYKELVEKKGWDSPDKFLESYQNLERKLGSDIRIPDELTDDHKSMIFSKLGKPETPDGYEYQPPEGMDIDQGLIDGFKQFAHQKNLPKDLFGDLINFEVEAAVAQQEAMEQAAEEVKQQAVEALRSEWKDNYDANFKSSKQTAEQLEILEDLEGLGLADHPGTIKMLHKISKKLSEDTLNPGNRTQVKSPQEEIKEIMESAAFKDRMHPEHANVYKRYVSLHGIS